MITPSTNSGGPAKPASATAVVPGSHTRARWVASAVDCTLIAAPCLVPLNRRPSFAIHHVSVNTWCCGVVGAYALLVPKLWTETIDAHRREMRDAILAA